MEPCLEILFGAGTGCLAPTTTTTPRLMLFRSGNRRRQLAAPLMTQQQEQQQQQQLPEETSFLNKQPRKKKNKKKRTSWTSLFLPDLTTTSDDETDDFDDDDDDDETASTRSMTSFDEISSSPNSVTFAEPLVTLVATRPYTSRKDRAILHYRDSDYQSFKYDWFLSTMKKSRNGDDYERSTTGKKKVVSFDPKPVRIHCYAVSNEEESSKKDLYYSESELQGFLDEFVQSLNQRTTSSSR